MRTLTILPVLLFALCTNVVAQTAGLEFSYGGAAYQMHELHDFVDAQVKNAGLSYKKITDLPSGSTFGAAFVVGVGKFETGVDYHQYSTESILQGDQNGTPVQYTHQLDGYSFGLFGKHPVYYSDKFQLKLGLVASLYATLANIENTTDTGAAISDEYRALSIAFTPMIEPVYYFTKWLYIGVRGAYAYDLGGGLKVRDDTSIIYDDGNGDPVKVNWTGFRADAFIGFRINNN